MQTNRKRDVDVLNPTEVDRLAAKMPARLRASVVLAAWCGLRWGETSELRRQDVSKDCATLRVRRAVTYRKGTFYVGEPKTAAGVRDVAIPPHIRPMLKAHLKNYVARAADSLLFPDEDGRQLREGTYRAHWEGPRGVGKPNLRVHDLRHVGAVLAAQLVKRQQNHVPVGAYDATNGAAIPARRRRPRRRNRRTLSKPATGVSNY
jgi:integrase